MYSISNSISYLLSYSILLYNSKKTHLILNIHLTSVRLKFRNQNNLHINNSVN